MEIPIDNKWAFFSLIVLMLADLFANLHSTSKVMKFETIYEDGISASYSIDTLVDALKVEIREDLQLITERQLRADSLKTEAMAVYSLIDSLVKNDNLLDRPEEEKVILVEEALSHLPRYEEVIDN